MKTNTIKDITKICPACKKEFAITAKEQKFAISKGGIFHRRYCRECLGRWRRGEIFLEKNN